MKYQIFLVIISLLEFYCHERALKTQYYWGTPEFRFPNVSAQNMALRSGSYIPDHNDIWGMGVWRNKIFVSIFRLKIGVLSSMNYFSMNTATKSPVLIPYPSYDANYVSEDPASRTNSLPRQSSIINSAFFSIDKCDRLWVIDAGIVDFFGQPRVVSQPALVIFNLRTNALILRYIIPTGFINSNSAFVNVEVDFKGTGCDDAYAYIADLFRSVIVYSLRKNRSWRLTHNLLGSDPSAGNFYYEGINFQWNFGILGIKVGQLNRDGSRRVYLKPFASTKTYYISSNILQNEAYIAINDYYYDVHLLGDRGTKGHVYDYEYDEETNVLFDAQFNRKRIGCWNTDNSYRNSSFDVVYKSDKLFFPVEVTIDRNRNLWMLTNNYPIFAYGTWDSNARNIRIYKGKIENVIAGTVCKRKLHKPKRHHHH